MDEQKELSQIIKTVKEDILVLETDQDISKQILSKINSRIDEINKEIISPVMKEIEAINSQLNQLNKSN